MNRLRLRAFAAIPFVLALAVHLSLLATWYDRLPDPLATHFSGADGRPDGYTGLGTSVAVSTALLLAAGVCWVLWVRRAALWGAWATAGFTGSLLDLFLKSNLDAAEASEARFPLAMISLGFVIGGLAALVGLGLTRLVPKDPVPETDPDAAARIELGTHEVAGWSRTTSSLFLTVLALVFTVTGIGLLLLAPWPFALLGLLGLVIGASGLVLARVRVTVDRHGLTVTYTVFPAFRTRVPFDDITAVTARDINPLREYGGWGYRVRVHGTAVVLHAGEAIVVRRASGRDFAVTVPDAATGAALLNTLRERTASDAADAPGERI